MTQQETSLFNELRREVENHELTKKELLESEANYKKLHYAFNQLVDEYFQKREVQGHDDI